MTVAPGPDEPLLPEPDPIPDNPEPDPGVDPIPDNPEPDPVVRA